MAEVLGRGGQARVAEAAGTSRNTVIAGSKELAQDPTLQARVRRPGAGPPGEFQRDAHVPGFGYDVAVIARAPHDACQLPPG